MPFITPERRLALARGEAPEVVGDLCYIAYKEMVRRWKEEPRWTTAHNIFKDLKNPNHKCAFLYKNLDYTHYGSQDLGLAENLAWQVFFQNYVMPYEREKEKENGTI